MTDLIIVFIVLAVVAGAIAYIIKEKKKGVTCVGCPLAGQCAKKRHGEGGCGGHDGGETDSLNE